MLLDCTFRDGGYYTNWHFATDVFRRYLLAVDTARIDYAEVGFRGTPYHKDHGEHADIADSFLRSFKLPKFTRLAVMVNARDYLAEKKTFVQRCFADARDSPITMVRVAASPAEALKCHDLCEKLSFLGYIVGLNLMQNGGHDLFSLTRELNTWEFLDVLYLADSLGCMTTRRAMQLFSDVRVSWEGDVGIHAHNNQGNALANTVMACDYGVTWLDATLLGMGRGAGNAPMEQLLVELDDCGVQTAKGAYDPLFNLALDDFTHMQGIYRWGPSLPYYLSASQNTHPTYVQEMLARGQFSRVALGRLLGVNSYDPNRLQAVLDELTT